MTALSRITRIWLVNRLLDIIRLLCRCWQTCRG
jgi:hypothetical protein